MESQLLQACRASKKSAIQQVITSLQELNSAITGGNEFLEYKPFQEAECIQNEHLNIGLAISGGVDSMALATLCSRLQNVTGKPYRLSFRAFVVDHGVRSASKDEARSVAKILESNNIPTSILKIEWPANLDPKSSPRFESLARTFRFQALGRACRDHSITSLFLAHHEDDQAETLLMRLAKGHRKRGLLGMNSSAPIPECRGIYGVDRSGGRTYPLPLSSPSKSSLECEDGGVMVHRPLLSFTKAQLRITCEKHGMPWFEDHTNADPRITMRNAIRHIYAKHTLPVALQKPSLLAMLSRLQEKKQQAIHLRRESWSSKLEIQVFDARLPYLLIRAQTLTASEVCSDEVLPIMLDILKDTIQIISSTEEIEAESLLPVLVTIFPELRPRVYLCDGDLQSQPIMHKFNKAGVQFTRQAQDDPSGAPATWLLTPEKAYRNRAPHLRVILNHAQSMEDQAKDPDSWHLWGGIYWVNIYNQSSQVFCLQHLSSVNSATAEVAQRNRNILRQLKLGIGLHELKGFNIVRHALPTITTERDGRSTGRIVAFPTLGIVDEEYRGQLRCLVRYKKVEAIHWRKCSDRAFDE